MSLRIHKRISPRIGDDAQVVDQLNRHGRVAQHHDPSGPSICPTTR